MPSGARTAKTPKSAAQHDAFTLAVERALEAVGEPQRLAAESPLAAPYFLDGATAAGTNLDSSAERGGALRRLLQDATSALSPEQQRLLSVTFFERDPHLNNTGVVRQLSLSEATYYRHRSAAIGALANALNERIAPPLRSELPRVRPIVDRHDALKHSLRALRDHRCVALTGASGVGKTALAAKIAAEWDVSHTFWFTVRPALNDAFDSLAFAMAHFLRGRGGASLWRQLVADRGRTAPAQTLGLLRHDLEHAGRGALLCVDEADLLRPETRNGAQVLHLLEEARELAPLLLIGQQLVIEPHEQHALFGLADADIATWFADEGLALSANERARTLAATRGNPAMLRLLISLIKFGDDLHDALRALAGSASSETLFNRLWRRLDADERRTLGALAVFDGVAPADAFDVDGAVMRNLVTHGLVLADGRGGISVTTTARAFARAKLSPEAATELHRAAARVREARGEFTAAARHYLEAGETALAVWLLYRYREIEATRGNAAAMRALLAGIRANELSNADDRRALALIRAEQAVLVGDADHADDALNDATWPATHPATHLAQVVRGYGLEQRGQIDQALALYRAEFGRVSENQLRLNERLHVKTGYVYLYRVRDLKQASREAQLALHQAEEFMGLVAEEQGRYSEAIRHYEAALALAQRVDNGEGAQAATHSHLGHLHMRRGDAAQAIGHLEIALKHAHHVGQPVHALYHRLNLASALIVAGRHAEAIAQAEEASTLAEAIGNSFLVAGLQAARAEAHLGLGDLIAAEAAAQRSLREEEDVHRAYALTVLGRAQAARDVEAAKATLRMAIESAVDTHDKYAEAHAWRGLADVEHGEAAEQARQRAERLFAELRAE